MYKIKRIADDVNLILGEMPNMEMPTMGGLVFWETKKEINSFKLQVNMFTGHARILDGADYRIAWGTYNAMLTKFKMLTCEDELVAGDIIGVKRLGGIYEHYAVYIGNDEIIHYAGTGKDFSDDIKVRKAKMSNFLKDSSDFFVLDFPDEYGEPTKINYKSGMACFGDISNLLNKLIKADNYKLFSPEETVRRAKSRMGENEYNLVFNNCEHFAIWCKTGISESHQVNNIMKMVMPLKLIKV